MASEKDLDRALHSALEDNESFRTWFLSQLRHGCGFTSLVLCRSNHPWGKVRLILPNEQTGALAPIEREGETDVLAVFESPSGKRLGVHIENKLASGAFTPHQAEVCAARAEHWIGNERYGAYHSWETVLLAPRSFLERREATARKFMTRIAHEQIALYVPAFSTKSDT